jgi:hypothetical protein
MLIKLFSNITREASLRADSRRYMDPPGKESIKRHPFNGDDVDRFLSERVDANFERHSYFQRKIARKPPLTHRSAAVDWNTSS